MSRWQPDLAEERWMAAAARFGLAHHTPWLRARCGPWKQVGTLARAALFLLAVPLVGTLLQIAALLHLPQHWLLTGAVLLASAEWLIRRRRMFCVGFDELLWLAGALMIAAQWLEAGTAVWGWRAALLITLAVALAAARFRNPGFGVLATLGLSATVFALLQADGPPHAAARCAAGVCFGAACLALWSGNRRWLRPSLDLMFDWQVLLLPLAAWLWLQSDGSSGASWQDLRQPSWSACLPAALLLLFALASARAALARRDQAPLLAAMCCCGLLAMELRRLAPWSLEVRLLIYGGVLLLATIALERWLRQPRRGVTSIRLGLGAANGDAGAAALATPSSAPPDPAAPAGVAGAGGQFGGAGAEDRY